MKNSSAIFQAGDARRRVKHTVIDYEIQIMAANRGLSQRLCAVTLEKWFYHFSSYLIIAAYYEGKQIALHRISYQRKDMVVNPQHCRRLTLKQTIDAENILLEQGKTIDFPLQPSDLSRYDEVLYD